MTKTHTKRVLAALTASLLSLSLLAACGGQDSAADASTQPDAGQHAAENAAQDVQRDEHGEQYRQYGYPYGENDAVAHSEFLLHHCLRFIDLSDRERYPLTFSP